jgi:hypothetical protein
MELTTSTPTDLEAIETATPTAGPKLNRTPARTAGPFVNADGPFPDFIGLQTARVDRAGADDWGAVAAGPSGLRLRVSQSGSPGVYRRERPFA